MNLNAFLQAHQISPLALLVFPVVLMLGMAALLAWLGGWRDLARLYPAQDSPQGEVFRFRSVRIQKWRVPTNYNNCVHVTVAAGGVGLAMSFFFRFRHDPVFISWPQIERLEQRKAWFGTFTTVYPKGTAIRIYLSGKAGEQVLERWNQTNR